MKLLNKKNLAAICGIALFSTNTLAGPGDPFNGIDVSLIDKSTGSAVAFAPNTTLTYDVNAGTAIMDTGGSLFFNNTALVFQGGTLYTSPGAYNYSANLSGGPVSIDFTVGAGQMGYLDLFDWGTNTDILVLNVWDVIDNGDGLLGSEDTLLPTDVDGDGFVGFTLINGPFPGFSFTSTANASSVVPVPAAVWLFGSGLIGLFSIARTKRVA